MNIFEKLEERGLIQDISDRDGLKNLKPGESFYIGFDPSRSSLQLGNLIPILVSVHLGKAGYRPIMLFGGSTGSIGDPSGKSAERQLLEMSTVAENVKGVSRQVKEIMARSGVEPTFVNNLDWTKDVPVLEFLREVGKHFTVNYMIAKEVVKTRLGGEGISYTEFSYMLLQAFDFLTLFQKHNCRLQIGGSDQWGNITAGCELIRKKLGKEAYALSWPLITDSAGRKLGKTEDGAIWLDSKLTSPYKLHQFFLNVEDSRVVDYLKIFTFLELTEIERLAAELKSSPEKRAAQKTLADCVVEFVHGQAAREDAERSAQVLFGGSLAGLSREKLEEIFSDVPSHTIDQAKLESLSFLDLLAESGAVKSKGEGRRLLESGGAYLNNERVSDGNLKVSDLNKQGSSLFVIRTGKKNYHVIKVQ